MRILNILILWLAFSASASALPIQETWVYQGYPSQSDVQRWSRLENNPKFIIHAEDPDHWQLAVLAELKNAGQIQIAVKRFPGEDTVTAWAKLAAQGTELIAFDTGVPSVSETERLNRIGFQKYIFVMGSFPSVGDAERLSKLDAPITLTFGVNRYPLFINRPGLTALPPTAQLNFVTDYWPWYSHMDLMNLLPHAKRLRVRNTFPSESGLQYLHNIHSLQEVAVETDFDPSESNWLKFRELPVRWISMNRIPSAKALKSFESTAQRRLVIDMDASITPQERARLEASPIPIEWIHSLTVTGLRPVAGSYD